ncbi:MAG: hypothetical protein QF479_05385 [Candidatus Poseidoniaceae archaeon]|jgi:uncharacterized OB-fold protein|nr:hypothetical protein [Candidatus Poseidoniaceae archaeon]
MLENFDWQGYKVSLDSETFHICSPWQLQGNPVFGHDSDYTTLAISLLSLVHSKGFQIDNISTNDSDIDLEVLKVATGIENFSKDCDWNLICHDFASLTISKSKETHFSIPNGLTEIDSKLHEQINLAWEKETSLENVSQGAYISSQQYAESLNSRLNLLAQFDDKAIWPPRQLSDDGTVIGNPEVKLSRTCQIESWTKLSALGAPSEFSIRAPLLDGISTVYVSFEEGARGVFLLTDDQNKKPDIGMKGEIVIRKIYSQEGQIRYGTKVQLI